MAYLEYKRAGTLLIDYLNLKYGPFDIKFGAAGPALYLGGCFKKNYFTGRGV